MLAVMTSFRASRTIGRGVGTLRRRPFRMNRGSVSDSAHVSGSANEDGVREPEREGPRTVQEGHGLLSARDPDDPVSGSELHAGRLVEMEGRPGDFRGPFAGDFATKHNLDTGNVDPGRRVDLDPDIDAIRGVRAGGDLLADLGASGADAHERAARDDDAPVPNGVDEGALVEGLWRVGRTVADADEIPWNARLVVGQLVRVGVAGRGDAKPGVEQRVPVAQAGLDAVDARVVVAVEDLEGVESRVEERRPSTPPFEIERVEVNQLEEPDGPHARVVHLNDLVAVDRGGRPGGHEDVVRRRSLVRNGRFTRCE